MEILKVEHLSLDFGGIRAVNNVSFNVPEGERLAIIGPNGAGKTSLFNLLTGQLKPDSGKIFFKGNDITHTRADLRTHLGMARSFQIVSLFPELDVLTNMMIMIQGTKKYRYGFFHRIEKNKNLRDKAEQLLKSMDLWERRYEPAHSISYGEQRKLEIALSLASDPSLLFLDEPSCGLTPGESADITARINTLGEKITVVIIAHDMDLVFGIAQRILLLHYGELLCEGDCEQIRNDPKVQEIYMGTIKK